MLLLDLNFEVGQCRHELFVVRTDSIASKIAVPPSLILIVCVFAEGALAITLFDQTGVGQFSVRAIACGC